MHVVVTSITPAAAEDLAARVVGERLAACVSVVPHVTSVYRWEGAVQRDEECLLVMKTTDDSVARLMTRLAELHPYDVPEIIALESSRVHAPYDAWLQRESASAHDA